MNLTFPGSADYKNMGKVGGPLGGKISVESGHLASLRTFENQSRASKAANFKHREEKRVLGIALGREAVESGRLASLRTHEHQVKAGREGGKIGGRIGGPKAGRKNVETGHIQALGKEWGRKNVESGHLASLRTPEHQRAASKISNCLQWHVRRGKPCICGKHLLEDKK
jgi:hypothetical protein